MLFPIITHLISFTQNQILSVRAHSCCGVGTNLLLEAHNLEVAGSGFLSITCLIGSNSY